MRQFLLLLFPALSLMTPATAQDYVIAATYDTLRGGVKIFTYDVTDRVEVAVKEGQKTKRKSLTTIQVKEISLEGKIYHPQLTNDGYRFIQLQTKGYLSLYLAHHPRTNDFQIQCLVNRSGHFLEVPGLGFKKLMTAFLSDCPLMSKRIDQGELVRKDIDKIIIDFNDCIEEQTRLKNAAPSSLLAVNDPKLVALDNLSARIQNDPSFPSRKDALDLIKDITQKVTQKQEVPRYLVEGLRGYLKDVPGYGEEFSKVEGYLK